MLSRTPKREFLSPEDLGICQRVFDQICDACKWDRTSNDAEALATVVISAFQCGLFNEPDLLAEMQARRSNFERCAGSTQDNSRQHVHLVPDERNG